MVEDSPRHCIEVLGGEDRPDKEMRPQDRACRHDRHQRGCHVESENSHVTLSFMPSLV